MLVKALRQGVGSIVVFADWVSRPKPQLRTVEKQQKVQAAMQGISLYQLHACPFCIKTRRALHRLNTSVDIRDIGKDKAYRKELESQGGRVMVPCLRIESSDDSGKSHVKWLYESGDIIRYLEQQVQTAANS